MLTFKRRRRYEEIHGVVRFIELFLQLETGCKYQQKGKKEVTHVVATWDGAGGVGGGGKLITETSFLKKKKQRERKSKN